MKPPISPLLHLPNTYRAFYGSFAELRPFQYEVIQPILRGHDLILQATTGSGKTEAVLAPCLERLITSGRSEAILYVVPTRALAQDLRRRLEPILHERLGLRLGIRTGDVKRWPAGRPDVLLTTPESLDVMLGSPNREVRAFLQRVHTLIIDEVHRFMQGYRGRHLAYLLQRLEQRCRQRLQTLTLSATLAGPEVIHAVLGLQPDTVFVSSSVQRQIQPHLVHLQHEDEELLILIEDLVQRFSHRKLLLFVNSRGRCDRLFALLRHNGLLQQSTYLHYSNLKPRQRQEVERQFQRRGQALCIATSTLELGIDVGDVDAVILFEPPESVTTFVQRLGRANRQAQTTSFWGICRGQRASEQLLQFLALCCLAQQGVVEAARPSHLPSVLVQQVLSCLYEHKTLSSATLQSLFPRQDEVLAMLLPVLEERHWLSRVREHGSQGLWRGGWRYTEALLARQIWSNFPDTETVYTLEVDGEAVADLPTSVVRQLARGEQVDLAGRRLRILAIQDGEHQVVQATPVEAQEAKELSWIGSGPPVSWEVAQAVRPLLQPDAALAPALVQGLFSRTRALLQRQQQRAQHLVVLHNGIELSRTPQGVFRYATYLGSMGNLILQRTIEAYYGPRLEDFISTADAFAVECTHRIDLQQLPLPVGRQAFQRWTARHLHALQTLLPLNVFCRDLPTDLLVEEVTDWLWDERLSQAFAQYRQRSSAIAYGDPCHLEEDDTWQTDTEPPVAAGPLRAGPQPPLLLQEKARLGLTTGIGPVLPAVPPVHQTPRALTGTMLGNYIEHRQCNRRLSFDFLPAAQQPAQRVLSDSAVGAAHAERGKAFEDWTLTWLQQQGTPLYRLAEQDAAGRRFSLQERQAQSFDILSKLIDTWASSTPKRDSVPIFPFTAAFSPTLDPQARQCGSWQVCSSFPPVRGKVRTGGGNDPERRGDGRRRVLGYLAQAVLVQPALLGSGDSVVEQVEGIGIPDVIEVAVEDATVWLTVIDIKDSPAPRYAQQWQVAFYAALLRARLQDRTFALPVHVADSGVIFTRPAGTDRALIRHTFDLAPYFAALPWLQRRIVGILTTPVLETHWQLQPHCRSCAYFDTCYRQALSTDNVMLLPDLTPGEYLKLRTLGLHTLPQAAHWFQEDVGRRDTLFGPQHGASLQARVQALLGNRLDLLVAMTSVYPANIATAMFVHLLRDPISGQPRAWGLHRLAQGAPLEEPRCWVAASAAEAPSCQQAFIATLQAWWQAAIAADQVPHLFIFGGGSWWLLREVMRDTPEPAALDFLWPPERHTDLQQLLTRHFALPIPLSTTLRTAAQVWGLTPTMAAPQDLFQEEGEDVAELLRHDRLDAAQVAQIQEYLQTHLVLQQRLWQACAACLRSDWQQTRSDDSAQAPGPALERACVDFLEQQRSWRERDILALQRLPLAERVERYRALGPLAFQGTTLDAEGRFLYHFRLPLQVPTARFRVGDLLKLNAVGSPSLQEGIPVLLARYEPHAQRLAVVARQGRAALHKRLHYTLDEDLEDWTTPRVLHAVRETFTPGKHPHLIALLTGALPLVQPMPGLAWAQRWLAQIDLNARQRDALLLPFRTRLGLIEGPPGTGKTHVLAWMLIALILEAWQAGRPMRLAVSALTHQAIDNVLRKVQQVLQGSAVETFPGRCLKWGRRLSLASDHGDGPALTYVDDAAEVLETPYLILGATGFGLYQLFDSQSAGFPAFFDWVILDEASQVLLPQALLSLIYGKGQYVFCGDVQQLPPVVLGPHPEEDAAPGRSILAYLLAAYDASARVRLNETYRLNQELCELPSRLWYQGDLHPTAANAGARLALPAVQQSDLVDAILEPQRPMTLVLAEHISAHQRSAVEVDIIVALAARLLLDYGVVAERLAIVAPHRAQNNAIAEQLAQRLAQRGAAATLPVIDTVERLQGAERDVVLLSVTTSDPDYLDSLFLNNSNRFNVAITRARHKLVVIGSVAFFAHVPYGEAALQANYGFKAYYHRCRAQDALFFWPQTDPFRTMRRQFTPT